MTCMQVIEHASTLTIVCKLAHSGQHANELRDVAVAWQANYAWHEIKTLVCCVIVLQSCAQASEAHECAMIRDREVDPTFL